MASTFDLRLLTLIPSTSQRITLHYSFAPSSFGGVGGGSPLLSRIILSPCQEIEKHHLASPLIPRMKRPSFRNSIHLFTNWCSTTYQPSEFFAYFHLKEKLRTYTRFLRGQFCIFIQSDCIIMHSTRFHSHPLLSVCTPSIDRKHNL